jgi:hypothetical protein
MNNRRIIKSRSNFFALAFFFLFNYSACSENSTEKNKQVKTSDTTAFRKRSFLNQFGKFQPIYLLTKHDVQRGGFKVLENGFDSIAFRFWYLYANPTSQVIEIFKTNSQWEAHFYTIKREITKNNDSLVTVIRDTVVQNPQSGWPVFIKKLFDLKVTEIPTSSEISRYKNPNDGDMVSLEIATMRFYELKNYNTPIMNTEIKEIQMLEEIMQLIEDEFGEKRIRKI